MIYLLTAGFATPKTQFVRSYAQASAKPTPDKETGTGLTLPLFERAEIVLLSPAAAAK